MSLHRSSSQNKDDFEKFLGNLELNFDHMAEKNPFIMVVLGDFYTKSKSWYTNDSNNFTSSKIYFLMSRLGFYQVINKPTHILNNSSSCIDLILTTPSNLVMESGIHSCLHANCHRQLRYVKFNLNVFLSTYERECGIINLGILIAFKEKLKILIGKSISLC